MTNHKVGTRQEWQAARDELLTEEKELTRRNDELAKKRSELPWVPVEDEYTFETDEGTKSDGVVYRTYLTTARGLEPMMGYYSLLDRTSMGRNEEGFGHRLDDSQPFWLRRHDEY
jgi:predicted dithiol-disulfide oxidoreductase (DUF899 family)